MPFRFLFRPGRARTPAQDAFVASLAVYARRAVMIFFLFPAAMPMGLLVVSGHFSFRGMAQTLFSAMANSGTDPNTIRVHDCPPPTASAGPIERRCEDAPMKDVPISILAQQTAPQLEIFYDLAVMIAIAIFAGCASPSPFDARGRFWEATERFVDRIKSRR